MSLVKKARGMVKRQLYHTMRWWWCMRWCAVAWGLFLGACVDAWSPPARFLLRRGAGIPNVACFSQLGRKSAAVRRGESGRDDRTMRSAGGDGARYFGGMPIGVQMLSSRAEDAEGNKDDGRTLEDLLSFASERGAFVGGGVGSTSFSGVGKDRSERLAAREDIEAGEVVLRLPETLALTAKQVIDRLPSYESGDRTGTESDALLMAGLVLARRGMMNDVWQRYAEWIGSQATPDLPTSWQGNEIAALGQQAEGRVLKLRGDMLRAVDKAASILSKSGLLSIDPGNQESILLEDIQPELEESWIIVWSRAVSSSSAEQRRFFPILDAIDHAPSPLPAGERLLDEASGPEGPALKVTYSPEGEATFTSLKFIPRGGELTCWYGRLSNEDFLLTYGRVPMPHIHGDNMIGFSLPGVLFSKSMLTLSESRCTKDLIERKSTLLQSLGVDASSMVDIEIMMGQEAMVIRQAGLPVPISIIARIMCLTNDDELAVMCMSVDGQAKTISPENEARAMRWIVGLLGQVEDQIFSGVDTEAQADTDPGHGGAIGHRRQTLSAQVRSAEISVLKCAREIAAAAVLVVPGGKPLGVGEVKEGKVKGKGKSIGKKKKGPGKGFG